MQLPWAAKQMCRPEFSGVRSQLARALKVGLGFEPCAVLLGSERVGRPALPTSLVQEGGKILFAHVGVFAAVDVDVCTLTIPHAHINGQVMPQRVLGPDAGGTAGLQGMARQT